MLFVVVLKGAEPIFVGGGVFALDKGADAVEALSVNSLVGVPGRSCFDIDTRLDWREGGNWGACVDVAEDGVATAGVVSVRGAEATRSIFAELALATGDCKGAVDGVLADNGGKAEELIAGLIPSVAPDKVFPGTEIFRSPGGGRFSTPLLAAAGTAAVPYVEEGIFLPVTVEAGTFAGLTPFAGLACDAALVLLLSRAGKSSSCRAGDDTGMPDDCEGVFFAITGAVPDDFTSCFGFPYP
jgi:hypothetical protein